MTDILGAMASPDLPFPHRTGYWVNRLAAEVRTRVDRALREHDLTRRQVGLLMHVESGRARTAAELTRALAVDSTAVTRMVDRLEEKGWLRRVPDPDDRRVQRIELLEPARAKLPELQRRVDEVESAYLEGLVPEDLATFHRVLMQMLNNVGQGHFEAIGDDD